MEKENVLEFEIIKINDFGIIGMLKQNTEILKRNMDTEYSRSYNLKIYVYIKDGQLVREEKTNNKRLIKTIYANGIEFLDELFKGIEENDSYKFVEVD